MSYKCYNCGEKLAGMETCGCRSISNLIPQHRIGQRNAGIVGRKVQKDTPEGLQAAYALINLNWQEWIRDWEDEHSSTNLYGLGPVDAILHIHKLLNERGL
jgi:hypothetical protein